MALTSAQGEVVAYGAVVAVSDYSALITASAQKYNVDPALVASIMQTESGGDPNANSGDAQGLMQLTPGTAAGLGVSNPFDPAQSIDGGTHYLAEQLARYHGDASLAIAAYNAGPGNVDKYGLAALNVPGADPRYLDKVLSLWHGGATTTTTTQTSSSITSAVQQFVVADTSGSSNATVYGQQLGRALTPAQQAATVRTGTPGPFGPLIDAANLIANEVFLGAIALALLSGGILWLASTDTAVRGTVTKAALA